MIIFLYLFKDSISNCTEGEDINKTIGKKG